MLFPYNQNNVISGKTKIENNTLSKIAVINGLKLKISYPYNFANNLSSKVYTVNNIKFGEKIDNDKKLPRKFNNASKSLELTLRKEKGLIHLPIKKYENRFLKENTNNNNLVTPIFTQKINFDLDYNYTPNVISKKSEIMKLNLSNKIYEEKKNLKVDIEKSN
jgi:hypothetical protein